MRSAVVVVCVQASLEELGSKIMLELRSTIDVLSVGGALMNCGQQSNSPQIIMI